MTVKEDKKQRKNGQDNPGSQQILQAFYKDFFSWSALNIGLWLVAGIMEFVLGIFLWMPYQEIVQEDKGFIGVLICFGMMGTMWYLLPYLQLSEEGKRCQVYEKLKYLPVSFQDIRIFRLKKLAWFCLRLFLVFFVGQLFFALVCFHEIIWGNIWYPVLFGLLIPLGSGGAMVWWSK